MSSANLQFSIAVHLLTSIAKVGATSSKELAHSVNTSSIYLKRILAKLSKAGLIQTSAGRSGGCDLSRPANKISLLDVYHAVEAPKAFAVHSYPKVKACDVSCQIQGKMENMLSEVQSSIESKLKSKTIADLLKEMKIKN